MPTAYPAARFIAGIESAIGWIFIVAGALALIIALISLNASPQPMAPQQMMMAGAAPHFINYIVMGISAIAILFGLVFIASGQMMRASTDTADYSREMLEIMRKTVPLPRPPLPSDLPAALTRST
jgi:hypothetical protein